MEDGDFGRAEGVVTLGGKVTASSVQTRLPICFCKVHGRHEKPDGLTRIVEGCIHLLVDSTNLTAWSYNPVMDPNQPGAESSLNRSFDHLTVFKVDESQEPATRWEESLLPQTANPVELRGPDHGIG